MAIFKAGDVIRVPVLSSDGGAAAMRPALVVSGHPIGPDGDLVWAMMITSAANCGWPGDVSLEADHAAIGLPIPSIIRTEKLALLNTASADLLGHIGEQRLDAVREQIENHLGYRG